MRWLENRHPLRSAILKVLETYLRAEVFSQTLFGPGRKCNRALHDLAYYSSAFPTFSSFPLPLVNCLS